MLFYFPVLVFFLLIIPAISVCFLKKNIEKLYDPDFQMKYGFIYQEYRSQCYYIEFIKIALKILIMITQSIYIDSMQLQVSVIQQILTVYLVVIIIVKPYTQHSANAIEMYNIIVCLLNMILANSIHWSQKVNNRVTTIIFLLILVVINIAFISIFIYFFFKQKIQQIDEKIIQLKYSLIEKMPKLKSMKFFRSTVNDSGLRDTSLWRQLARNKKDSLIKKQSDESQNIGQNSNNSQNIGQDSNSS